MRTKVFPVDIDNESSKLLKNIMEILNEYRVEKYPDTSLYRYGMKIMKLFDEFSKEQDKLNG